MDFYYSYLVLPIDIDSFGAGVPLIQIRFLMAKFTVVVNLTFVDSLQVVYQVYLCLDICWPFKKCNRKILR